ncbi:hypothetical protein DOE76_18530 [Leifsonia sp. ku-ls]|nr:hypothetical protein DOE76_18530 [Leifsonia sp. ku-ls]
MHAKHEGGIVEHFDTGHTLHGLQEPPGQQIVSRHVFRPSPWNAVVAAITARDAVFTPSQG